MASKIQRTLELLFEIGAFRHLQRQWQHYIKTDVASIPEHLYRVAFIALILARQLRQKIDEEKLLKMALVHDLSESRTGDLSYLEAIYSKRDEKRAIKDTLAETHLADLLAVWEEYEARKSLAAKIVKDADNLDIELEIRELEALGVKWVISSRYQKFRRKMRDRLYTAAGKRLFNAIHKADPDFWHLRKNKYTENEGHSL